MIGDFESRHVALLHQLSQAPRRHPGQFVLLLVRALPVAPTTASWQSVPRPATGSGLLVRSDLLRLRCNRARISHDHGDGRVRLKEAAHLAAGPLRADRLAALRRRRVRRDRADEIAEARWSWRGSTSHPIKPALPDHRVHRRTPQRGGCATSTLGQEVLEEYVAAQSVTSEPLL